MATAALKHQEWVKFGGLENGATVDVEADETVVAQFSQDEVVEGKVQKVFYYYVWLGVLQRGDPEKMYLVPVGLTRSVDQGRLPPLKPSAWKGICDKIFTTDSKVVLMSDGAGAYKDIGHPGLVHKEAVVHEKKEFSRSCEVLANTLTRQMRPGMAGTQAIDSEWKYLKKDLPDTLSARTEESRQRIDLYVRAEQWRRQRRNEDLWPRFCEALCEWRQAVRDGEPRSHIEKDPARQTAMGRKADNSAAVSDSLVKASKDDEELAAVLDESAKMDADAQGHEAVMTEILNARLALHGRRCDVSTPRDGDCLFHALKAQGFVQPEESIPQMRRKALFAATEEELQEAAAVGLNVAVEEYVARMLRHEYADPCMLQWLCRVYEQPAITVHAPTNLRSWTADAEHNGALDNSFWVAFDDVNHYFGTLPL